MKASYDFRQGCRGAVVPAATGQTRITMRLDNGVLAWFRQQTERAGGGNYQTLINAALREHMPGDAWGIPCGASCARSCAGPAEEPRRGLAVRPENAVGLPQVPRR